MWVIIRTTSSGGSNEYPQFGTLAIIREILAFFQLKLPFRKNEKCHILKNMKKSHILRLHRRDNVMLRFFIWRHKLWVFPDSPRGYDSNEWSQQTFSGRTISNHRRTSSIIGCSNATQNDDIKNFLVLMSAIVNGWTVDEL